jgi:hypothetical protein
VCSSFCRAFTSGKEASSPSTECFSVGAPSRGGSNPGTTAANSPAPTLTARTSSTTPATGSRVRGLPRRSRLRGARPRAAPRLWRRGGAGPVKLPCNPLVGETEPTQVPALRPASGEGKCVLVLGATGTLAVGLSARDCLALAKKVANKESFQASQARPRPVYVPTAVQVLTPACFARPRTLRVLAALGFSLLSFFVTDWPLQFTFFVTAHTGRRCTRGGTGPDFHCS